eukprot:SAG11_NODE_430_length_9532_cov_13.089685_1_plen_238_part_00
MGCDSEGCTNGGSVAAARVCIAWFGPGVAAARAIFEHCGWCLVTKLQHRTCAVCIACAAPDGKQFGRLYSGVILQLLSLPACHDVCDKQYREYPLIPCFHWVALPSLQTLGLRFGRRRVLLLDPNARRCATKQAQSTPKEGILRERLYESDFLLFFNFYNKNLPILQHAVADSRCHPVWQHNRPAKGAASAQRPLADQRLRVRYITHRHTRLSQAQTPTSLLLLRANDMMHEKFKIF